MPATTAGGPPTTNQPDAAPFVAKNGRCSLYLGWRSNQRIIYPGRGRIDRPPAGGGRPAPGRRPPRSLRAAGRVPDRRCGTGSPSPRGARVPRRPRCPCPWPLPGRPPPAGVALRCPGTTSPGQGAAPAGTAEIASAAAPSSAAALAKPLRAPAAPRGPRNPPGTSGLSRTGLPSPVPHSREATPSALCRTVRSRHCCGREHASGRLFTPTTNPTSRWAASGRVGRAGRGVAVRGGARYPGREGRVSRC